ncbi:transaldolase family protein [Adhaeretor mobilis]|uniref:Transaldolase n=1 Tax=Adhaeretor mobilis TaxID=1930276 RepID=A0A517MRS6_9BACT|nr:transaldolase family protein [Adhaeretor mobilis]QDS97580.1 Transaldolase [Adhaeretor mobilis]
MPNPLKSIIDAGTKLWLDSVDPDLVLSNRAQGATGATSNPIIISNLIKTGRYDQQLAKQLSGDSTNEVAAWALTDQVVSAAQEVFHPVWKETGGNDGYVSFELDPLLEDPKQDLPHDERVSQYIELGTKWSQGHDNRMIKVPATPAGLAALEELATRGVTLNVTLIFTQQQYEQARDAIWRGAQRRDSLDGFKSVYSIFISRVDVYTQQQVPDLSSNAQGQVGLVNVKQMWQANEAFWSKNPTPLEQEIVFASTGAKLDGDPAWKYVAALVGSGIQTNPPATNEAVAESGMDFPRTVDQMPEKAIVEEIAAKVDLDQLQETLMREGVQKFVDPQQALLALVAEKRKSGAEV